MYKCQSGTTCTFSILHTLKITKKNYYLPAAYQKLALFKQIITNWNRLDWIESLMVSWSPFQKYKPGWKSATVVVNSLNTQKVKKDEEEWFNYFTWSIHCDFNHLLNKTGLEGSFLNTLTNKLSVFKQQLLLKKKLYDQAIWLI